MINIVLITYHCLKYKFDSADKQFDVYFRMIYVCCNLNRLKKAVIINNYRLISIILFVNNR